MKEKVPLMDSGLVEIIFGSSSYARKFVQSIVATIESSTMD